MGFNRFCSNDFHQRGLILFTIRIGNFKKDKKPYAEKAMIVEERQETPMHIHWSKMEDIINRGGGNLVLELYSSDNKEAFSDAEFDIKIDSVKHHLKAKFQSNPYTRRKYLLGTWNLPPPHLPFVCKEGLAVYMLLNSTRKMLTV